MDVQLSFASGLVDQFEELLCSKGISIPRHDQTHADMLPFWMLLKQVQKGFSGNANELRKNFTAAVAAHDLSAKILEIAKSPQFDDLLPHLEMLTQGAVHLTEEPPADADTYNKMIEIYWASLCISAGLKIDIDDPKKPTGKNPDVIVLDDLGNPVNAYAFKTIRSPHTQNILDHLAKGIDQIEKSSCDTGIVALHLTPRLQSANIWPVSGYFSSWTHPAVYAIAAMRTMISEIIVDNGQKFIDDLFLNKKAAGAVLCIAFCPTVAAHPVTSRPTVMPLKVSTIINLVSGDELKPSFVEEINRINHAMQIVLG